MAEIDDRRKLASQRSSKMPEAKQSGVATSKRARKVKVTEAGSEEQEGDRSAHSDIRPNAEQDKYRHGGIPLGSDPRE